METTRNSMMILSFTFSLRLRFVTVMFTVAPAGIAAPFVPLVASVVVAVTLSPIALVLVQILELEARTSVVPAATVPVRGAGALPDVDGVVVFGVVLGVVLVGVVLVPAGRVTGDAGALAVPPFAVSLSVSFPLSLFAIARFAA